ncbi:MAG: DUF389 domain-containing protein [Planctomycetota bacterium]|nr:MAG: DUF389 domain-containing protein [Planctomycetota bacterium]
MSVLVVVSTADEAAPLVRWGARFARALKTHLDVLHPARGTKPSEAVELRLDDDEDQHPVRRALRRAVVEAHGLFSDEPEGPAGGEPAAERPTPGGPAEPAAVADAPPPAQEGSAGLGRPTGRLRCAECHEPFADAATRRCPECFVRVHSACWERAGGCPTLGCSHRAGEHPQPPLERSEWISLRSVSHPSRFAAVLAEIEARGATLIVVGKHTRSADELPDLGRQILARAVSCDVLVLRASGNSGVRCERILVPAAGGPHAAVALRLADAMARDEDGLAVPLFVEPDADDPEVARAVGERLLSRALASAGVSPSPWLRPEVVLADRPLQGIADRARGGEFDLLLVGASDEGFARRLLFGTIPERLLAGEHGMAVAVVRRRRPLVSRLREAVVERVRPYLPSLGREDRIALFERLQTGSRFGIDFFLLISLSTAIASLGLIQNSAAVVIGAMLVAPLMTPMIGAGLGLVQGNAVLVRQAARSVLLGVLTALLIGFGVGLAFGGAIPGRGLTDELLARGSPNVLDLLVAFLSGLAAAYALARPELSGALPGVAIAAALVPPIATVGISFAQGAYRNGEGAAALFGTNLVAIVLGAAIVFRVLGVQARREQRARVWAQRLQVGLWLTAAVIAVPLASSLLGSLAERQAEFELTPRLRHELRHAIEEFPGVALVALAKLPPTSDRHRLEVVVAAPVAPPEELANRLAARARELSGLPVEVSLVGLRYEWSARGAPARTAR